MAPKTTVSSSETPLTTHAPLLMYMEVVMACQLVWDLVVPFIPRLEHEKWLIWIHYELFIYPPSRTLSHSQRPISSQRYDHY